MNVTALMTALMLSATAAPEITELYPTPLALGATIEPAVGSAFAPCLATLLPARQVHHFEASLEPAVLPGCDKHGSQSA